MRRLEERSTCQRVESQMGNRVRPQVPSALSDTLSLNRRDGAIGERKVGRPQVPCEYRDMRL